MQDKKYGEKQSLKNANPYKSKRLLIDYRWENVENNLIYQIIFMPFWPKRLI
jgi:hypothetical protein